MTPGEIEAALRQLLDKDAIVDLVHRYSFLFDHRRLDEVAMLFTEDCVIDYGLAPVVNGREALQALFSSGGASAFIATSHNNANVLVTFTGPDQADVATSLYAWHQTTDGVNPRVWGYYFDQAVRTPDGWRLARRELRVAGHEDFPAGWNPLIAE